MLSHWFEIKLYKDLFNIFIVGSTIQTILEEPDVMEKLTALLDLEGNAWWRFGKKLGMSKLELDSLRPESPPSPTELLMNHIVGKEPDLNMKSFLEALANIKRIDVIRELKQFFSGKIVVYLKIGHDLYLKCTVH